MSDVEFFVSLVCESSVLLASKLGMAFQFRYVESAEAMDFIFCCRNLCVTMRNKPRRSVCIICAEVLDWKRCNTIPMLLLLLMGLYRYVHTGLRAAS